MSRVIVERGLNAAAELGVWVDTAECKRESQRSDKPSVAKQSHWRSVPSPSKEGTPACQRQGSVSRRRHNDGLTEGNTWWFQQESSIESLCW